MAASALRADSTFCPTLAKNTTEQKTSKRIVLFDKEECNLHWYGPGYQILLRKSSDFRELVQNILNALKANQQMTFNQNATLPTLVNFRLSIDVISVLVEYQYYLCFCFKLFVFDVVGSWFYQTKFSKPVGHFNRELGPHFSPCTHIVSHTVSNILPVYAHCFTYCIKYSPRACRSHHILH